MPASQIVPMSVSGVRFLVERAYRESGELQYLRELLINGLEAGASRFEFGPEWNAVEREGVYRLMAADDGKGMNPAEMLKFLNTFGGGGKPIGDAHENYGVGAKTSLLPWNETGMVVLSWTAENPAGAMVWLMKDQPTGEYGARKFETADGYQEVVVPFGEWAAIKPAWIKDHGTVVVCLGNTGTENTFLGKTGNGDIKGISAYLNKRIWDVPDAVEIYVQELRTQKREEWPRSHAEASGPANDPDRRWNRRRIRGARHYATTTEGGSGSLGSSGTMKLSDGTEVDWYLWDGDRPKIHSYAHMNGYIAANYKNELYDVQQHVSQFRSFGITQTAVRNNLTLVARPPHASSGSFGVYPDTARNALKMMDSHRAGEPLPWAEWAQEFAENLPGEIVEALAKAAPSTSGSLADGRWKDRLIDRFGSRWRTARLVPSAGGGFSIVPTTPGTSRGGRGSGAGGGSSGGKAGNSGGAGNTPVTATLPSQAGTVPAVQRQVKGGLPDFQWVDSEVINGEGAQKYAAAWSPPSVSNPSGLVQLAKNFPAMAEVRRFWTNQYPDHMAADIEDIISKVYGEVMVARIAHSEQLVRDANWGQAQVDAELRTPAALTMSLLGLMSEDQLIGSRVSGLGLRRSAA